MAELSGNSCNIITILPLGLECDAINASTPTSTNGLIALYITGGTSPYYTTWSNGQQGTLLYNLTPGEYTATVTDYYGDFTATTTCTVGYDSFYLEQFENCQDSATTVFYLADLVNPLSGGSIYQLSTQIGCWINNGTTLYTGQTYINSYPVVTDGPFTGCTECLPTPVPPPVYPSNLCLQYTSSNVITQIDLTSGGTINGYPFWSSVTETVFYNTGTTRWEISGWTYGGNVYKQTPSIPPTGYWTLLGSTSFGSSVYVSTGTCQSPPITLSVSKTEPICSSTSSGSITVVPNGGVIPYTYSIDSVNYQASNTFLNLSPGPYTVYVSDGNNTIVNQTVILGSQQPQQTYNVSLTLTPGTNINVGDATTKTSNWSVNVSPYPLPNGVVIDMDLIFNVGTTAYTGTLPLITYSNTINTNQTGNFTISSGTTTGLVGSVSSNPYCESSMIYTSAYTTSYNVQLSGTGTVSGTIVQYINTPCDYHEGCNLFGNIKDTVNIQNITISPTLCNAVNGSTLPQQVLLQKTGLNCYKVG